MCWSGFCKWSTWKGAARSNLAAPCPNHCVKIVKNPQKHPRQKRKKQKNPGPIRQEGGKEHHHLVEIEDSTKDVDPEVDKEMPNNYEFAEEETIIGT